MVFEEVHDEIWEAPSYDERFVWGIWQHGDEYFGLCRTSIGKDQEKIWVADTLDEAKAIARVEEHKLVFRKVMRDLKVKRIAEKAVANG